VWKNRNGSIDPNGCRNINATSCCIESEEVWPGTGNLNIDPQFVHPGTWDDNGTPENSSDDVCVEGDYHLRPGSPCIDAGTSEGVPTFDIEGNGRPCGAGVEIGVYEFGDCWPSTRFRRGDADANGIVELTDVIRSLTYQFVGGVTIDCLDSADIDDSGMLELTDAIRSLKYQFVGIPGTMPAPPGPFTCGPDVNDDAFPPCEYPVESCE